MRENRRKYRNCVMSAKQRGIIWQLTYITWRKIWATSGHWNERGPWRGQYCMARFGDKGPYAIDNVKICTVGENHSEAWLGKKRSAANREKIRLIRLGRSPSAETRKKMSIAQTGRKHTTKSKEKMSRARQNQAPPMYGKKHSEETKRKMSEARKMYWQQKLG